MASAVTTMPTHPADDLVDKGDTEMLDYVAAEDTDEYKEFLRLSKHFTGRTKTRLVRSIDMRVLSVLTVLYLAAYIDRSNIGNAALFGLKEELGLSSSHYNNALMSFFFTYALFDIPSTIFLKRFGPATYIALAMTAFGIITIATGFVKDIGGLVTCRVLLGVFESGLFPGVVYILSSWYTKYELQTRIAIFFGGASASGAFAGLLAYAIANLDGKLGHRAWHYIFWIEGGATTLLGLTCYFYVSDTPEKARWLKPDERRYLTLRLKYSSGNIANTSHFEWKYVKQALSDWKGWCGCLLFLCQCIPVYGLSYTMPTIVKNLGFSAARAQGITAPPYIFAALFTIAVSILSDRYKKRWTFLAGAYALGLVGYVILVTTAGKNHLTGVTLFGIFLTASGMYACTPPTMAWIANNTEGQTKRAVTLAIVPTIGQLGGVIGSQIYLSYQAPKYPVGFGVSMAAAGLGIVTTVAMRFAFSRTNARRGQISEEEVRARYSGAELTEMGDKSPLFRYTL
ncbi:hypothetical protein JCM10207_003160 [Rhodosporidiobolus poonsookiae]